MVTLGDVRRFALTLSLTTEALVGGRVKFRVGRLVYPAGGATSPISSIGPAGALSVTAGRWCGDNQ
jgi:hypothetical protein